MKTLGQRLGSGMGLFWARAGSATLFFTSTSLKRKECCQSLSGSDSAIPGTVARQAPLSMEILQARILECVALLQGIFPTQGSNPGLPHCRQILYHLNHQGSSEVQGELSKSSGAGGWISERYPADEQRFPEDPDTAEVSQLPRTPATGDVTPVPSKVGRQGP